MNHQSNHQESPSDATTDRAGATRDQGIVSADGPGAAAARQAPDPDDVTGSATIAAEIAAMAAAGPHMIASHGDRLGRQHRTCSCGRGTPPTGALTAATAESFVAKCRAAQDGRDAARERATRPGRAGATPATTTPADSGAGDPTPGAAQTLSGPPESGGADWYRHPPGWLVHNLAAVVLTATQPHAEDCAPPHRSGCERCALDQVVSEIPAEVRRAVDASLTEGVW